MTGQIGLLLSLHLFVPWNLFGHCSCVSFVLILAFTPGALCFHCPQLCQPPSVKVVHRQITKEEKIHMLYKFSPL